MTARVSAGARIVVQPLLIVVAAVALVLGCIGYNTYYRRNNLPSGPVDVLYAQLDLFRLGDRPEGTLPWTLQLARFLAPLVVGYGLFRGTVALFRERLDRVRLQTKRRQVVVIGSGDAARTMARAMQREHRTVVLLRHEVGAALTANTPLRGILSYRGDASMPEVLDEVGVNRAAVVVALTDDDAVNLAVVLHARSRAGARGRRLRAVASVNRAVLCRSLRVDGLNDASNVQSIDYVNTAELAARSIAGELEPGLVAAAAVLGGGASADATVVVDAPTVLAAQVAVHVARRMSKVRAESGEPRRPSITVQFVGENGADAVHEARLWAPDIDEDANLSLAPNAGPVIGAVFARQGVESMATALLLAPTLHDSAVVVVGAADAATLLPLVPTRSDQAARVVVVDIDAWATDPEIVLGGTVEVIARATHDSYRAARRSLRDDTGRDADASLVPWDSLSPVLKESNRAQARHVTAKLAAVRCTLVPSGLPTAVFDDVEVERLAQLEHMRWCAERRAAGWTPGPRDATARTTPYLVPWDELSDDAKALDRAAVANLPTFLADAGYAAVRIGPSTAEPG